LRRETLSWDLRAAAAAAIVEYTCPSRAAAKAAYITAA
jgi:hypothetical protein